jgi:hypothetical protein
VLYADAMQMPIILILRKGWEAAKRPTNLLLMKQLPSVRWKTLRPEVRDNEDRREHAARHANRRRIKNLLRYCTFSFKSTGGVTRDLFYLFDILAAAEFLRDTSKISTFEPKISSFLHFLGSLVRDRLEIRQRPE